MGRCGSALSAQGLSEAASKSKTVSSSSFACCVVPHRCRCRNVIVTAANARKYRGSTKKFSVELILLSRILAQEYDTASSRRNLTKSLAVARQIFAVSQSDVPRPEGCHAYHPNSHFRRNVVRNDMPGDEGGAGAMGRLGEFGRRHPGRAQLRQLGSKSHRLFCARHQCGNVSPLVERHGLGRLGRILAASSLKRRTA